MKKRALTFAIVTACGALLYAGPESLPSGKEMKNVVPMPPPCPTWAGFYVGGFGGLKFAAVDVDLDLDDFAQGPVDAASVEDHGEPDLSTAGFELGGIVGYNFQFNHLIVGFEATGGYLWLRDSEDTELFVGAETGDDYHVGTSFKTHYLFTFAPRIGYAFCRWMPYITGGLAVGDIDFDQKITRNEVERHFVEGGHTDDAQAGWMVGGGVEFAITNHWKARLQYQYIDLGDAGFNHDSTEVDFSPGDSEIELREHNASLALLYSF